MKIRTRRASRYSRTSTSGGSVTATQTAKGTKSITNRSPSTSTAESVTPGVTTIDTSETPGGTGGLFVALTALYIVALWNQVFSPIWTTIWTGTKPNIQVNAWIAVGGLLFIFLITGLARISKQWESAMWVMTIGMWLVYFTFNGKQLSSAVQKTTITQQSNTNTQAPKSVK